MSDLHLEYHKDRGASFISSLNSDGVDVLVLAGDISEINHINFAIEKFCEKYPQVVMVPGNHEFYNSDAGNVFYNFETLEEQFSNFHFLNNKIYKLNGHRFLGTTLWYSYVRPSQSHYWSDFHYIKSLESWVYDENKTSSKWLDDNVQKDDIVITHMLPSPQCIAPQYEGNPDNVFFVCDKEELIINKEPKFWFFGHTHIPTDIHINKTRLVCNPRGYINTYGNLEHNGFNDNLILEID